jgi:hypothetical protein
MAQLVWSGTHTITQNMARYGDAVKDVALNVGNAVAPRIETDAKNEASWTDRTGHARAGLNVQVWQTDNGDVTVIQLAHGMYYGIFLEVRNQGRYAIIMPILQRYYPVVWRMITEALR